MPMTDLQQLRRTLARRLQEKAELEAQVRTVQARLENEVAPLREEVLRLQMEQLKDAAQARMRSAKLRNAYHEAQDAYEEFRERRGQAAQATKEGEENLKALYRRATKRCHPDAVPDAYQEEAAATFQAIESVYDAGHSEAVRAIAEVLDRWGFPPPPAASDEAESSSEDRLRRAVSILDTSIERLRSSPAYRVLTERAEADVEALVGAKKRALQERLRELKRRRHARF